MKTLQISLQNYNNFIDYQGFVKYFKNNLPSPPEL